jgi:hypothetical protein
VEFLSKSLQFLTHHFCEACNTSTQTFIDRRLCRPFLFKENSMHLLQRVGSLAVLATVLGVAFVSLGERLGRAQGEIKKNTKYPQHVLIIRHAEKTGEKTDPHLSMKGMKRADVLFQLFELSKTRPNPLPVPNFIFAASNSTSSVRPLETVTPLARKLQLPIDHTYDSKRSPGLNKNDAKEKMATSDGMLALRAEIFGDSKYFGKTILVSWRHSTIPELSKTLGASSPAPKWDDNVFDRVWQLSYNDRGHVTFSNRTQRLLPGDAEE